MAPARVAHQVLDAAVDAYFPILDQLDEFVDEIEQRVFGQFDEELLQEIFKVKRLVISLRRYLAPQREVLSQLTKRPSPSCPPRRSSTSATSTITCCASPTRSTAIATAEQHAGQLPHAGLEPARQRSRRGSRWSAR